MSRGARRRGRVVRVVVALGAAALIAGGCLTVGDVLLDRTWTLVDVHGAPPVADVDVEAE